MNFMKLPGILLAALLCAVASAATSDILFPHGGATFPGAAGNVVFDGQQFVTPVVQTNGVMALVRLDTNGTVISNMSLAISGSAPRLDLAEGNYLLAWLD